MQALGQIAAVVTPVFLTAAAGYVWARLKRPFDSVFVSTLVTDVATPCLIFNTLTRLVIAPEALAAMAWASILCFVCFAVVGIVVLKLAGLSQRCYLPAILFPNNGNMGLPLSLFAFGEPGLAYAVVYFAVASLLQFSIGPSLAMGSVAAGRLLRLPVVYAVAAAPAVMALGLELPGWVGNTTQLLGSLAIPLMLMALGVALARLRLAALRRSLALSLLRLGLGFTVGWSVGAILELEPAVRGVLAIQSAMPVAVFNYIFAERYGRAPAEMASMVLLSTVLSFVTLPLLLAAVM